MATLLAVHGVKMGYGVLLLSETQGVGKTTLGETICGKVLGVHNAVSISASVMIDNTYQYWAEKQLIVINEIHEDHRVKVYNKLKSTITDGVIDVNKKWYAPYKTKNFVNVFACSNDPRALSLPNDDRRWLVLEVTDVIQANKFWDELRDWLENQDGYRRVRQWAKDYVAEHGVVARSERAPRTRAREEMIYESYGDGVKSIMQPLDWVITTNRANCHIEFLPDDELRLDGETVRIHQHEELTRKIARCAKDGVHIIMLDTDAAVAVTNYYNDRGSRLDGTKQLHAIGQVAAKLGLFVGKERITMRGWANGFHARITKDLAGAA